MLFGELLALTALLCFSANVLLLNVSSRRLKQEVGFLLALGTNVLFAGLLVLGQYTILGQPFRPQWSAIGWFVLGGLLTSYLGRWCFFLSVRNIGPTRASSLQITNPMFAAAAAWIFLGEALPPLASVFLLSVVGGLWLTTRVRAPAGEPVPVAVAVPEGRAGMVPVAGEAPAGGSLPPRQVLLALLGAMAYGIGNVVRGAGVRDWEAPVFGSLVGAAAGLVIFAVFHTDVRSLVADVRRGDRLGIWLWVLSGVITIVAQMCVIGATLYIPVAVAVVISAAIPVVILPVSVIFLRRSESVTVSTAVGALFVFAGVTGLILI
jgi:drug/metabolite transporter (DMT)-like permease